MAEPLDYRATDAAHATPRPSNHPVWTRRGKAAIGAGVALWAASWVWFKNDPNVSNYRGGPVVVALVGIAAAVAGVVMLMIGLIMKAR